MAKKIAKSLTRVLESELIQNILNCRANIQPVVEEVLGWWNYDLYKRKPGPAYRDGVFVGTDLDLACFLYALVDRKALIVLPTYKRTRAATKTEGEYVMPGPRRGRILNLISNQAVFSFSVLVNDLNVVRKLPEGGEEIGAYRNFSLTRFDGEWSDSWTRIEFMPDAAENDFITSNKLWDLDGMTISFKNFVHPNRWTSFYGQYYFITKALIDRLIEESAHYRTAVKAMLEAGIEWPDELKAAHTWPKSEKVAGEKIKTQAFEVQVDLPEAQYDYPTLTFTQDNLVFCDKRLKFYRAALAKLRFATRATELAYYKHATKGGSMPNWIGGTDWEQNYREPGKRTDWDRLVLFQPKPGQRGVAIRKRTWMKTEEVSA